MLYQISLPTTSSPSEKIQTISLNNHWLEDYQKPSMNFKYIYHPSFKVILISDFKISESEIKISMLWEVLAIESSSSHHITGRSLPTLSLSMERSENIRCFPNLIKKYSLFFLHKSKLHNEGNRVRFYNILYIRK